MLFQTVISYRYAQIVYTYSLILCSSVVRCILLQYKPYHQMVMMYGCVFVVVGILETLTTASQGLMSVVGEYEAVKDNNEVDQCVTSPPNTSFRARSRLDCMRACISSGCSCAHGANYHSNDGACEMHSDLPDHLEQVPHCVFYQVLDICIIFTSNKL